MSKEEIEELLAEPGIPCVSIIIPTHRIAPDGINDPRQVNTGIKYAKELLMQKYSGKNWDIDRMIKSIDQISKEIDYTHSKEGIGIFVSTRIARLVKFPFEVTEKIKVEDAFDSRDLLYYISTIIDYCVLSISRKHIHLFTAKGAELQEIKNEDFPIDYTEEYEYSKPSRGISFGNNAFKDFERDKSVMQEVRLIDFLRKADHLLRKYVNDHIPLVISGGKKEIADYVRTTIHTKRIIGKVAGNYNSNGHFQLANLSWKHVQNYLKNQTQNLLLNLHELIGKEMVVIGIEEVWKAAKEGKGLELIVEKDFESPAFISTDGFDLKKHKPTGRKPYLYAGDTVEKTIKTVREKKGKVVFVGNGEMKDLDAIALKLRYNDNQF